MSVKIMQARPVKSKVSLDGELNRNYVSTYRVVALKNDGPLAPLQAQGIPRYDSFYRWYNAFDTWAYITGVDSSPIRDEDIIVENQPCREYLVTINWSTNPLKRDSQAARNEPWLEPPKISGSFINYTEQTYRDRNNKPIVNKAKEPIIPPLQKESSYDNLLISFNTLTINLGFRSQYRNTVNSAPIWGLPKRRVKLNSWRWQAVWTGPFQYISHEFEFFISNKPHPAACGADSVVYGWYDTVPNMGHCEIIEGKQVPILEREVKKREASYLNCEGQAIRDPNNTNETWLRFEIEDEKDFTQIPGIPVNFGVAFV